MTSIRPPLKLQFDNSGNIHKIQFGLLILFIASGILIIQPLHAFAIRYTEELKNTIIPKLESTFGIQLRYKSVSPSVLTSITIQDLEIKFEYGDFSAKKIRILLNPIKVLRDWDKDPMQLISGATIVSGHLNIALPDSIRTPEKPGNNNLWSLLESKALVLKDFSSTISSPRIGNIDAQNLLIQLEGFEERIRYHFSGSFESENLLYPDFLGIVKTDIDSSGSFSSPEKEFNGRIDIHELSSELFTLSTLSVDLTYTDGQTIIRRIEDGHPIDINAQIDGNNLEISGQMVKFVPGDLIGPGTENIVLTPWLDTVSTGSFTLNWEWKTKNVQYKADMTVSKPKKNDLPWPWELSAKIIGNNKRAIINTITVTIPHVRASYSGQIQLSGLYPTGNLNIDVKKDMLGYPITGSFRLFPTSGVIFAELIHMTVGDLEFSNFDLLVMRETNRVTASLSVVPVSLNGTAAPYQAWFDAMLDTGNTQMIYGAVTINGLETLHAAQLLNASYLYNFNPIQDSLVNIKGMFQVTPKTWSAEIEEVSIISKSNPSNHIFIRGRLTPATYSLDNIQVAWNGFYAIGNGFSIHSVNGGTAQGRLLVGNELYPVEASWNRNGSLWMAVSDQIEAKLGPPSNRGRKLSVKTNQVNIPVKGGGLHTEFELQGIVAKKNWDISIVNSRFDFTKADRTYSAVISGRVQKGYVTLRNIEYSDDYGVLQGYAVFTMNRSSRYLSTNMSLESDEQESYNLSIQQSGIEWNMNIVANHGKLERFNLPGLRGLFNLQANLDGSLDKPSVYLEVSTIDSFHGASPFNLYVKGEIEENNLKFSDMEILFNGISLSDGVVLANAETGSISGTANLSAAYNQIPVSTGFSFGINIGNPIAWHNINKLKINDFKGTLATHAVLWNQSPHLPPFTFQFSRDSEYLRLQTPDKTTLNVNYSFTDGQLDIRAGDPLPIELLGGGTVDGNEMNLSFTTLSIDPILINYIMLQDPILLQYHVIFQGGRLTGKLDVRGPTSSPGMYGTINAVDLKVDTPYTYANILPTNTSIEFNGSRITFDRIEVPVGNGIAWGEGYIVLDSWQIADLDLTYGCLSTKKGDGVPVSYPLMGVYFEGLATGSIHMTGNSSGFLLDGDFRFPLLNIALGSPRIPQQKRKKKNRKPVTIDIGFETGENCTFYLPNEQLKIVSATAQSNRKLDLYFDNNPRQLTLTGTIPIMSGGVYYFDRNFKISEGQIIFAESLNGFNPVLQLRAETQVREEQDEDVIVALIYDAPIRSPFNPSIETTPPRSENEVLSLLGQAVLPGETFTSGEKQIQNLLAATGGMLTEAGIVQPFEKALRKGLNLDMVTIRTDIIENALAERLVQTNALTNATESAGLGRYLDNTNLYIGKYFGDALFASGSLTVRYFEENQYRTVFGGLEFETAVSLEMVTPFFNVEWAYSPNLEQKRNFIADNTITLKWQFTY